jgi:hypothetical protein
LISYRARPITPTRCPVTHNPQSGRAPPLASSLSPSLSLSTSPTRQCHHFPQSPASPVLCWRRAAQILPPALCQAAPQCPAPAPPHAFPPAQLLERALPLPCCARRMFPTAPASMLMLRRRCRHCTPRCSGQATCRQGCASMSSPPPATCTPRH